MKPEIDRARAGVRDGVFEYRFTEDEPLFRGHFPGRPLLPGVFQLEMAREAAERILQRRFALREVEKAKFTRPVLPGETIRLELRLEERENGCLAVARFSVNDEPAGESRLLLE